jgi:uncharacterized protein (TIGR02217 family)
LEFVDIQFPHRIAMGAQRRPGWRTSLAQSLGGFESTNQDWSRARHSYDISFAVRTGTDYQAVASHFHQMRGRFRYFPFKDVLDYRAEASNGVLLDESGSPTVGYQLAKRYGSGSYAWDRPITRPRTGTVAVYRTRAGNTVNITAQSTITYTTGMVVIAPTVYQPGDVLSWSGEFYVPCRYDLDDLPAVIVDKHAGSGEFLVRCDSIPIVEVRE